MMKRKIFQWIALVAFCLLLMGCTTEEVQEEEAEANIEEAMAEPTVEPTDEPTVEPTQEPTAEPTQEPTAEPTQEPTAEPTQAPTPEPTSEPTPVDTQKATADAGAQAPGGNAPTGGGYAVNNKNGKIHIVGQCPATGNGEHAMDEPIYFATYEEAEAYSVQRKPKEKKRQCGNCW